MTRRLRSLLSICLLLAAPCALALTATEQQLKAAYLVNFLKYVEWPDTSVHPTICLFGRDVMSGPLSAYEGRLIGGQELVVRRVSSPEQFGECRILFVPDVEDARFAAVLRWTEGQPILTVSDAEYFARQGGGIALVHDESRLQFDVNLDNLNRGRLKAASQMLRLARQVIGGGR